MRALEFGEAQVGGLAGFAGALFAQRDVRGQHAAFGRELAFQKRANGGFGDLGRRRTSGDVIVHINDLIERADDVAELGQRQVVAVVLKEVCGRVLASLTTVGVSS